MSGRALHNLKIFVTTMKRVDFSGLVARDEPLGLEPVESLQVERLEAERLGRVEGHCFFATYQ